MQAFNEKPFNVRYHTSIAGYSGAQWNKRQGRLLYNDKSANTDVSRRYQPALSLTNKISNYICFNHIVFLVFTHASRSYALRSAEKIKQIYLWIGASAERQAAAPFGRKPACFRRFRPRASHTSGERPLAELFFWSWRHRPIVLVRSYGPVPLAAGSANRGANRA